MATKKVPKAAVVRRVAKPKPLTTAQIFNQWLAKDPQYQHTQAGLVRNQAFAQAQETHDIADANTDLATQKGDWQVQKDRGQTQLTDDYAARGLGQSGIYADQNSKWNGDQQTQLDSLTQAVNRRIAAARTGYESTHSGIKDAMQAAKDAAAARRSASLTGVV